MLFGAPFFGLAAAALYLVRLRHRPRTRGPISRTFVNDVQLEGVIIPYSLALALVRWLWPLIILVFFGPLLMVTLLTVIQEGAGASLDAETLFSLLLSGSLSLYAAWFLGSLLSGKLSRGLVALTPAGVYHRSVEFHNFVAWESVLDIRAAELEEGPLILVRAVVNGQHWLHRTSHLLMQQERKLAPDIAIRGQWLSVDPALLYYALCYYHEHPEARAELSSEAGAQRLRTGDLEV